MAKKAVSKTAAKGSGTTISMRVAHRIESLLHTMRVIERHEEQLCVLMTEIKNTGEVSDAIREELHGLLEELPADAYRLDLEAVSTALLVSAEATNGPRSGTRKAVPAKRAVKRPAKPAVRR